MFRSLGLVGLVLLAAAGVIVAADAGGMSRRMPTQVPPRRIARYPFLVGFALLTIAAVGLATV